MTSTYSARRHAASLDIITRALNDLGLPRATHELTVDFRAHRPCGDHTHARLVRRLTVHEVADRVFTALYGRLQPTQDTANATAEDMDSAATSDTSPITESRERLVGQLETYYGLNLLPWYPLRARDIVHVAYEASGGTAAYGETYQVRDSEGPLVLQDLVLVGHTAPDSALSGAFEVRDSQEPLVPVWVEAGQDRVTVIRDGVILHNGPGMKAV